MKGPLWRDLRDLALRIRHAPGLILFVDFDGTLTPLADDPGSVELAPAVQDLLCSLAAAPDTVVVVVSGRALDDLQKRVGVAGIIYAGNHGLEISGPDCAFVEPSALEHRPRLKEIAVDLAQRLREIAGARVEDKELTVSVHYRQVPEALTEDVRRIVHTALANSRHPFRLTAGKKVFDIRPRVEWTKGHAVNWIRAKTAPQHLPVYLGDDATDEDAFAALPDGIAIKVGGGETAAQYHLAGPEQVRDFLVWLVESRQLGVLG